MTRRRRNRTAQLLAAFLTALLTGKSAVAQTIAGRMHWTGPTTDLSTFVIWIDDISSPFPAPTDRAVLDQKDLRFVPHVLAIQVGTTVEFPNVDPVSHNVFSISEAKRFNLGLYGREVIRRVTFDKPGVVELLCNVHLEMSAYIVVVKNPYFTQTTADGSYRLSGVPAGRHRLRCWHERLRAQEQVVDVPEGGPVTVDFFIRS